ncbi:WD repeat-containing protein 89 [Cylas formicarius]|uniref:WD repeat-containing protein 89 n=1 Tax=Cylas formicarius TaxID=197179 RepID=UPI0029583314|nr:WD repeat-containing protein 89 [Cylas formicarius]
MSHYTNYTEANNFSSDSDADPSRTDAINERFAPCSHVRQKAVASEYILHVCGNSQTNPYLAVTLLDNSCEVFDFAQDLTSIARFKGHEKKVVECKFDDSLLYTGSNDGTIKLWDTRSPEKEAISFVDRTLDATSDPKSINSFDVSANKRLLAAGTDLIDGDAFILFWDVRSTKLLGGYWESHTDDITQVRFHPDDSNTLMSGSTDGLINIYNLVETSEDDALQQCLNTEKFVDSLTWFDEKGRYRISCVTSTVDLQLWDLDGAEPYARLERNDIASQIMVKTDDVYVAEVVVGRDHLSILVGSKRSLRSLKMTAGAVQRGSRFVENGQRVRCAWYNRDVDFLVTGGESGLLDVWRLK